MIFFFHEASHFPQKINCRAPFQVAPSWYCLGFPGGSEVKASACNVGDLSSIPGLGRSPGEGNGNPLQYSCLENPMDGRAWWAIVHGVAKSQTGLSNFTFTEICKKFTNLVNILDKCSVIELSAMLKIFWVVKYDSHSYGIFECCQYG